MAERTPDARHWHRLDNTANLFPVISNRRETNVYRLSLNLSEAVAPELLQQALETALPWFPAFRVRLHKGFFWHYLEENPARPLVQQEEDFPCRTMDPAANGHFLFRLTYFGRRINLETYHVLSDGTGSLQFLRAIACQYLLLAHPAAFTAEDKATLWFADHAVDTEDSYVRNYTPTKKSNFRIGRGYRLKGERNYLDALSVVHAHMPVDGLLALCRGKGVSITQYLAAVIAWGLYESQLKNRPSKYPVNLFVPVNLRKLFASTTTLNFFSNIYITLQLKGPHLRFDEVLAEVKRQFTQKLSREAMLEKISYTVGSGYSPFIRAVPLVVKMLALRLIFIQSAKSSSLGFSNVGQVVMPPAFAPYVTGAGFLLSTVPREPFKAAACSYGGTLTFTLTSVLRSMDLQRAIIRKLAADGLDVTVQTNGVDYESL